MYLDLQDIEVQSKDFEGSLPDLRQLFTCADNSHRKLVVLEAMVISEKVDDAQEESQRDKGSNQ